jgi:hypothetical protein
MRKFLFLIVGAFFVFSAVQVGAATTATMVSGSGSLNSYDFSNFGDQASYPWLINETITGNNPFLIRFDSNVLTNLASPLSPGTLAHSIHQSGKWFQKTVLNDTNTAWTSFELEVQSTKGVASTDGDGLSFAQGSGFSFTSDRFAQYTRIDDTKDYLNFNTGIVNPGQTVTFTFAISDNGPNNPIWLQETVNKVDRPVPIPAAAWLLGSGLVGLLGFRRKFSK